MELMALQGLGTAGPATSNSRALFCRCRLLLLLLLGRLRRLLLLGLRHVHRHDAAEWGRSTIHY